MTRNDFAIVDPAKEPAGVKGANDVAKDEINGQSLLFCNIHEPRA